MIRYRTGDLFYHAGYDKRDIVICHITNDIKAWGSGFVVPLGKKYPKAKEDYLNTSQYLGKTNFVCVDRSTGSSLENGEEGSIWVANMCAQRNIKSNVNQKPIRYSALVSCMEEVKRLIELYKYTNYIGDPVIYAPKFGSCRAGGNWDFIEELINEIWSDYEVQIFTLA